MITDSLPKPWSRPFSGNTGRPGQEGEGGFRQQGDWQNLRRSTFPPLHPKDLPGLGGAPSFTSSPTTTAAMCWGLASKRGSRAAMAPGRHQEGLLTEWPAFPGLVGKRIYQCVRQMRRGRAGDGHVWRSLRPCPAPGPRLREEF